MNLLLAFLEFSQFLLLSLNAFFKFGRFLISGQQTCQSDFLLIDRINGWLLLAQLLSTMLQLLQFLIKFRSCRLLLLQIVLQILDSRLGMLPGNVISLLMANPLQLVNQLLLSLDC